MPLIRLADVSKVYPPLARGASALTAVDGVSLDIEAGDVYGVIGYSGAGKSTLVRLINGLETPTSGQVVVDGTELTGLSERGLRPARVGIGFIFQQFNLLRSRTVAANVAYPLRVARFERAAGTGGPGRHPGGDGVVRELLALANCEGTLLADRRVGRPYGLAGGRAAAAGANAVRHPDGTVTPLAGKAKVTLREGDTLVVRTPGGGGWGTVSPARRVQA